MEQGSASHEAVRPGKGPGLQGEIVRSMVTHYPTSSLSQESGYMCLYSLQADDTQDLLYPPLPLLLSGSVFKGGLVMWG